MMGTSSRSIGLCAIVALALAASVARADEKAPALVAPFEAAQHAAPISEIDKLVASKLAELKIDPARPCSDVVFFRRVYLDVVGYLPTSDEVRSFLADKAPSTDKRAKVIDRLLADERYADYWAMRWGDWLRVRAEFPINLWPNAAQAYHRWLWAHLRANTPWDQVAREMLTASGSNFRTPAVNFYRAMQGREPRAIAQTVALTFLGARADKWPTDRLDGLAAFFAQVGYKPTREWKEEIVHHDPAKAADAPRSAIFPNGTKVTLADGVDPRTVFADWLLDPKNPQFSRALANRLWAAVMGRGIVHEADDIRDDNPPSNPALLDHLARELVSTKYDVRHLLRLILNSRTYQSSFIPRSNSPQAAPSFAFYRMRRLEAELLIDALNQITGTNERYSSPIPEPFTFIPPTHRAVELPDSSLTSSFLEMFGRPSRDTGLMSERNNGESPDQRLHMLNSSHVQNKILNGPRLRGLLRAGRPRENLDNIYLAILSRFPTADEAKAAADYANTPGINRNDVLVDMVWALINSTEFRYRH